MSELILTKIPLRYEAQYADTRGNARYTLDPIGRGETPLSAVLDLLPQIGVKDRYIRAGQRSEFWHHPLVILASKILYVQGGIILPVDGRLPEEWIPHE